MKILDKYILKKFFTTFIFVVLLLAVIVLVIDYTEKSDDFIKHNLAFKDVFQDYYVNVLIHWISTLSPISVFIAVVFMTARLASHSEVIAILTNGVSFNRFLAPYIFGASILGILSLGLVGWVVPETSKEKVAFEVKYLKRPFYFQDRDIHIRVNDTTYLYMESYNNRIKRGYRTTVETIKDDKLIAKLSAPRIEWDSASALWKIDKYTLYSFNEQGDETMVKGKKKLLDLGLDPKYFESKYKLEETLTITELDEYVKAEIKRGNSSSVGVYLNAKHERLAYPFAFIILTIMGVMISSRKSRQGSGLLIAIGFVLAFIYIMLVIMGRSIAQAGSLDPLWIAWGPNILFSLITAFLYTTVQK